MKQVDKPAHLKGMSILNAMAEAGVKTVMLAFL